jgi:hypothetical protein
MGRSPADFESQPTISKTQLLLTLQVVTCVQRVVLSRFVISYHNKLGRVWAEFQRLL